MATTELKAVLREEKGGNHVKRLRKSGWIPCVIYGKKEDNLALKVESRELIRFMHSLSSDHAMIKLNVDGEKQDVMLQDVQYHPFRNEILHVDFHKVAMDEKLTTSVVIEVVGDSKGVAAGGVLEHIMRELTVECFPKDLPSYIEIDITDVEVGHSIHVGDIAVPEGVKFLDDPAKPVISVLAPRIHDEVTGEEAEVIEEETSSEPQLIRKREQEESSE